MSPAKTVYSSSFQVYPEYFLCKDEWNKIRRPKAQWSSYFLFGIPKKLFINVAFTYLKIMLNSNIPYSL